METKDKSEEQLSADGIAVGWYQDFYDETTAKTLAHEQSVPWALVLLAKAQLIEKGDSDNE